MCKSSASPCFFQARKEEQLKILEAERKRLQALDEQERTETTMYRQKLHRSEEDRLEHEKERDKRVGNTLQEISNALTACTDAMVKSTDAMVKKRVPSATFLPELATWLETSGLRSLKGALEAAGWTVNALLQVHAEGTENFHVALKPDVPETAMRYQLKGVLDLLYSELA